MTKGEHMDFINDVSITKTRLPQEIPVAGFHVRITSGRQKIELPVIHENEKPKLVAALNALETMMEFKDRKPEDLPDGMKLLKEDLIPTGPVDDYNVLYYDGKTPEPYVVTLRAL